MKKFILLLSLCFVGHFSILAQKKGKTKIQTPAPTAKKPLTHAVYDFWKDMPERAVSNNGQWFAVAINPQEGDGRIAFKNLITNQMDSVARGTELKFSTDSEFAVFKIKPPLAGILHGNKK
ncbi:MAG: hypothetical protein EAZ26_11845 [Runella slithyformis]|nr:MAG: hypothetical protein EAZ38_14250 [Cytophagales bacterium]TAG53753.1 MAG: hypothetical protein EAZ29_05305 [Runella slithyformis]TAG63184.1 MAG: hypothetical protein EAZ26_11845 [Runella slithyformis]